MVVHGKHLVPATLPSVKKTGTRWRGGLVENRAVLDEYEEEKISFLSPEFDPRNVQAVATRYTDCAVSAPIIILYINIHGERERERERERVFGVICNRYGCYTIIVPTKCTSLLKEQYITIRTFCLCILSPYMFQPRWAIFRGRNASA
jgi:bacteriorhodopsin